MSKKLFALLSVLVVVSMFLAACGAKATEPTSAPAAITADPRALKLIELDATFRSSGMEAWLKATGATWSTLTLSARQPEEQTFVVGNSPHITVIGVQLDATAFKVVYPACITTANKEAVTTSKKSRTHQPDLTNPSILYTDVTLNGPATYYAICTDWAQLNPTK